MKPVGKPKRVTKVVPAKMPNVNETLQGRLLAGKEESVNVASGGEGDFPTDCPVWIEVARVMGDFEHEGRSVTGLLGHIVSMDCYTKGTGAGTVVTLKMYRDPNALAVLVDDEEVYRWVEDSESAPLKFDAFLEEERRVSAAFVEQVDLQPGDEVLPGEVDGTYEIIRTARDAQIEADTPSDEELLDDYELEHYPDGDDELLPFDDDEDEDIIEGELG